MRGKIRKNPINRYGQKPPPYRPYVNATEEITELGNEAADAKEALACEASGIDEEHTTQLIEQIVNALKGNFKPKDTRSFKKSSGNERPVDVRSQSAHPIICTNCLKWGHSHQSCNDPKITRCWGCGQEGVTKLNCNQCNGNQTAKND